MDTTNVRERTSLVGHLLGEALAGLLGPARSNWRPIWSAVGHETRSFLPRRRVHDRYTRNWKLLTNRYEKTNRGEPGGTRTRDPMLKRHMLYRLSYRPLARSQ